MKNKNATYMKYSKKERDLLRLNNKKEDKSKSWKECQIRIAINGNRIKSIIVAMIIKVVTIRIKVSIKII
jgi:hypothetical protein